MNTHSGDLFFKSFCCLLDTVNQPSGKAVPSSEPRPGPVWERLKLEVMWGGVCLGLSLSSHTVGWHSTVPFSCTVFDKDHTESHNEWEITGEGR